MPSEVSTAGADQDLGRLVESQRQELSEAHRREAATADVLKAISGSKFDLQAVFDAIVQSGLKLFSGAAISIALPDGDMVKAAAVAESNPARAEAWRRSFPFPLTSEYMHGVAILDRRMVDVPDVENAPAELAAGARNFLASGYRSVTIMPMMRGDVAIGALSVVRPMPGPLSDKQLAVLKTFADQAVIAIENTRLFEEVQARTRELQQALEYQTATSEVLSVISKSPSELRPVFTAIVQTAQRLCGADRAQIFTWSRGAYRLATHTHTSPETVREFEERPITPSRSTATGRALLERRTIHVPNVADDPEYDPASFHAAAGGARLAVPLLSGGHAIGVIALPRTAPFTRAQIELVTTFADQAVIAIENARLFEEVQARTRELQESLEYQTATGEVLGVISRSPTELQPVLDSIAATAARLCESVDAQVYRVQDGKIAMVAQHGTLQRPSSTFPGLPLTRGSVTGRAVLDQQTIHVDDLAALVDSEYPDAKASQTVVGHRTTLATPLLRRGESIGAILLRRIEVRPFSERQRVLLQTFADQAVIAIENTRLFEEVQARTSELSESLEQQTATSDVLKVISRSGLDLQRVLDALVESAARLTDANDAAVFQVFGDGLRLVAHHGQMPMIGPVGQLTLPLGRGLMGGRAVIDRRTIQVADMLAEADDYPESRRRALQLGYRTALAVPLVHAGEAIGVIFIRRSEVRPFAERQIELVETFADQAVIAIENARLFNEIAQKSRDLELASQHKSQFVANMSHELRTPLAAMLGYAELLQEGIYGALPQKSLSILMRIRSNGKHLLGLINTVLDISKIEAGQFKLNLGEYALGSVVETVMVATESLAATKKLAFKTEVAKGLPYGVGDEQRLTQVLLNLVGNAIKFTDAGEVRITASAKNGHFELSVSDTGPGIPPEECERIFEKFRQVDSSNTRAKGGTGLGLAIAREIVEMHGGRIWVESAMGQGSTFRMELPVRAAAVAGAA
jgi:signal transduction histidine kinase